MININTIPNSLNNSNEATIERKTDIQKLLIIEGTRAEVKKQPPTIIGKNHILKSNSQNPESNKLERIR